MHTVTHDQLIIDTIEASIVVTKDFARRDVFNPDCCTEIFYSLILLFEITTFAQAAGFQSSELIDDDPVIR
jgi:hypothetical protein